MRTFTVPENLLHKLMPIESYVEVDHVVPYLYQLSAGGRLLSVIGTAHSNVPTDTQFSLIEQTFRRIDPDVVLVEGLDPLLVEQSFSMLLGQMNRVEAITRGGESVFTSWLAHKGGADWQSIEPNDDELYSYLEALGFTRDVIFAWYILRLLPQCLRRQESMSFAQYVVPFMHAFTKSTKWQDFTYSLEHALSTAATIVGAELTDTNVDLAYTYTDPRAVALHDNDYTVFNTLSATANELRDRSAVTRVLRALGAYERVFVVFGAGHAVMQEPIYRAFFEQAK